MNPDDALDAAMERALDRDDLFADAVARYLKEHDLEVIAEWERKNPGEEWEECDLLDLARDKVERIFAEPDDAY